MNRENGVRRDNMMKKIVLGLFVLLMVLGAASCKGNAAPSSTDDNLLEQSDIFSERELEIKDITILRGDEPNDWDKASLQKYEQKYGGKVNFITVAWADRNTRLQQLVQANDSPDMVYCYNFDAPALLSSDLVQPVDDYIQKGNAHYNLDLMKLTYSKDGKMYAFVVEKEDKSPWIILYNKEVFKKMGVEYPIDIFNRGEWDWATFKKIASDVTDTSGGTVKSYGFGTYQEEIFAISNGDRLIVYEGEGSKLTIDSPAAREAFQLEYDMINVDKSMVPSIFASKELFTQGKLAMYVGNSAIMREEQDTGKDIDFVPFPKGPSADKHYAYVQTLGFCIPKGAKNVEGGMAFAEINATGFPAIEAKRKPKFTDEQKKVYFDYCANPVTTWADAASPFKDSWIAFINDIRAGTTVGTAIEAHKGAIQASIDVIAKK